MVVQYIPTGYLNSYFPGMQSPIPAPAPGLWEFSRGFLKFKKRGARGIVARSNNESFIVARLLGVFWSIHTKKKNKKIKNQWKKVGH